MFYNIIFSIKNNISLKMVTVGQRRLWIWSWRIAVLYQPLSFAGVPVWPVLHMETFPTATSSRPRQACLSSCTPAQWSYTFYLWYVFMPVSLVFLPISAYQKISGCEVVVNVNNIVCYFYFSQIFES